jgi:hypothetical protein
MLGAISRASSANDYCAAGSAWSAAVPVARLAQHGRLHCLRRLVAPLLPALLGFARLLTPPTLHRSLRYFAAHATAPTPMAPTIVGATGSIPEREAGAHTRLASMARRKSIISGYPRINCAVWRPETITDMTPPPGRVQWPDRYSPWMGVR